MKLDQSLDFLATELQKPSPDRLEIARVMLEQVEKGKIPKARWHPSGFLFMKLTDVFDGKELRFHFWPVNLSGKPVHTFPRIHKHNWHLTSHVLCGSIINTSYAIQKNSRGQSRLYEAKLNSEGNSIRTFLCRCDTKIESQETIPAGKTYRMDRSQFHTTKVHEFTATLVLSLDIDPTDPKLVVGAPDEKSEEHYFERSECDPDLRQKLLDKFKTQVRKVLA